jgi:F0F1-type ATP synthase delta subunit
VSAVAATADYILPAALITRADLARLMREVEALDNDLEVQKVRNHASGKTAEYHLPTMSRSLHDFLEQNQLNIADDKVRVHLRETLKATKDHAPIMHMTFAVEAEPDFLQQLVAWLRQEIHPQALLSVGLQPALVGGVYVRTPNHVHDFSIRELLAGKRDIIRHELEGLL